MWMVTTRESLEADKKNNLREKKRFIVEKEKKKWQGEKSKVLCGVHKESSNLKRD